MRSLFAREFRDAFVRNLIILAVILSVLYLADKLSRGRDGSLAGLPEALEALTLCGLLLGAFVCGERAFPPDLKERRLIYLSILPIRRGALWLAIFGAHCLAAMIAILLIFFFRGSLADLLTPHGSVQPLWAPWILSILPVLFFVGATLSLAMRKAFSVYISGFVILSVGLFEAFGYSQNGNPTEILLGDHSYRRWAAYLALLIVILAALSARLFREGEITSPKRRLQKTLLIACGISAWWIATLLTTIYPEALGQNNWMLNENFYRPTSQESFLSPNGKYLVVVESLEYYPKRSRVSVVNLNTRQILGSSKFRDLKWAQWAGTGDVLEILTRSHSLLDLGGLLFPETTTWTRLSPSTQFLSSKRLPRALAVGRESATEEIFVAEGGDSTKILSLNSLTGTSSELARGPLSSSSRIWEFGSGKLLVQLTDRANPGKTWIIENQRVHEIPTSDIKGLPHFIFGRILDFDSAERELTTAYPSPTRGGQTLPGFIPLPDSFSLFIPSPREGRPFFLETLATEKTRLLWTWNGERWRPLGDIPSYSRLVFRHSVIFGTYSPKNHFPQDPLWWRTYIDFSRGIAVYTRDKKIFLYDVGLDREISANEYTTGDCYLISGVTAMTEALLMCNQRVDQSLIFKGFRYRPGSGTIKEIFSWLDPPVLNGANPLRFEANGSSVWASPRKIFRVSAHGHVLQIWPPDPTEAP